MEHLDMKSLGIDKAEDRDYPRTALADLGIDAFDSALGRGLHTVEVFLFTNNGQGALSIMIDSLDAPCELGLTGFRTDSDAVIDCTSTDPIHL